MRRVRERKASRKREHEMRAEQLVRDMFPAKRETTTMSIDNVGQATGAVASIENSLQNRINKVGQGKTYLDDEATYTSGLGQGLAELIGATANQATEIEQDLIVLVDVIRFLSVEITMAAAAGRPTGKIEAALTKAQDLDGGLRAGLSALSAMREALGPVQRASENLARALAADGEQAERVQQRLSAVRHEAEETQALISAIADE